MSRSTTAAESLTTAAALFAGPGRANNSTSSVNGSASFHFVVDGDIQTLSTKNAPKEGPIKGLLYVPSLDGHDECNNTVAQHIPANATRYHDVARFGYHIIGLAPWVTPNCSQWFLETSRRVGTDALVFFLPSSADNKPPPAHDETWLLNGESPWKDENLFPIYAIPGQAGTTLMEQLSHYSGNKTELQERQNATSQGERWDVRLFTIINLEKSGRKTPSIWGFLLAILGTLLVLCVILLLLYQLIQRRRREMLQRRLEFSEVDYEQHALQHIRVSREFLAKLPIYTYPTVDDSGPGSSRQSLCEGDKPGQSQDTLVIESERRGIEKEAETDIEENPQTADTSRRPSYTKHANRLSHSQPTCAICLEDFVPASSTVRELPCGHIYHPECIDVSLTRNSSLCPLCKKSVLPPDLYPISMPEAVHRDSMRLL
ncbi:hypothetical protein BJX68DRAFT_271769 [Aspergillus pseudodeflectus]|uniref:RING-type domain-containing protein n=1 Tax=Aspergillus pseudodeflectus TaxID=176178 RepID=A0ABR4JKA2_9EURO